MHVINHVHVSQLLNNVSTTELVHEHISFHYCIKRLYFTSLFHFLVALYVQNSKSIKGQIKYLVYCMENAILDLPPDQEQMIWMIDFHGFNLSHISIKVTRETAHVLQEHYPERLGIAILYNPPKIFEPFWMVSFCISFVSLDYSDACMLHWILIPTISFVS